MKYRAWHFDESPNDGATIEAVDAGQAIGIYSHDTGKPADEIVCVPLLAAPVEVEMIMNRTPEAYEIPAMDAGDASDYLRLFNGAPRMLELLIKISQDAIKTPNVQEAGKLVNLIIGESK